MSEKKDEEHDIGSVLNDYYYIVSYVNDLEQLVPEEKVEITSTIVKIIIKLIEWSKEMISLAN